MKVLSVHPNPNLGKKPFWQRLWESFRSLDRFTKIAIVTLVLMAVSTPFIVGNLHTFTVEAQGIPFQGLPDVGSIKREIYKRHDDALAEVGNRIPGFGGMRLSSDGTVLQVYLTKRNVGVDVGKQIKSVFGSEIIPSKGIEVLQGEYTINELKEWYDSLHTVVWDIPGVTLTDLEEDKNRLEVGVSNTEAMEAVKARLSTLGIPVESVNITLREKPSMTGHTLQDRVRPLLSGLQVYTPDSNILCTLGFISRKYDGGSFVDGFVIPSHCTPNRGILDNAVVHQPYSFNPIGTEVIDPPFFTSSDNSWCPEGKRCRWSDSAFVALDQGQSYSRGYLARPVNYEDLRIDHKGRFRVSSKGSWPAIGSNVRYIGKSSGMGVANVEDTCIDTGIAEVDDIVWLCQHVAYKFNAYGGGDSGAPVFRITNSPSTNDVILYGMAWGYTPMYIYFSPTQRIYDDLGPTSTWYSCYKGRGC